MAYRKLTLVYGGASVGIMGAVANSALAAGGQVIGVMPTFLVEKEIYHKNLTELILLTPCMSEKQKWQN
jgi:predicted Rossmann-fold nucleotide-binding protein